MPTFNIYGHRVTFPDGPLTLKDKRRILREQAPELYREVVLGDTPAVRATAAQRGFRDVARGTGALEAGLVGMGATGTAVGRGVANIVGGPRIDESVNQQRAQDYPVMEALREERPVSTFVGESIPYMAAPVGPAGAAVGRAVGAVGRGLGAPAMATAGRRLATSGTLDAAITGGGIGLLESGGDVGAALRGAGAGALGGMAGRALTPRTFTAAESPAREAVRRATAEGFEVAPTARYKSPLIQRWEDSLERLPVVHSNAGRRIRRRNQQFLNSQLRDTLNIAPNEPLTKQTFNRVIKQSEDPYVYPLQASKNSQLDDELIAIGARETQIMSKNPNPQWGKIDWLRDKLDGDGMDARELQLAMEEVERQIKSTKGEVSRAWRDVKESILDALRREHGDQAAEAIAIATERRELADAAKRYLVRGEEGVVDYRRLLKDHYRGKTREKASPSGFKKLLEKGEAVDAGHALGYTPRDLQPYSSVGRWLSSPASGFGLGGLAFGNIPGAMATGLTGPGLGLLHYSGVSPRLMDRGLLGSVMSDRMIRNTTRDVERAGRAAAINAMNDERPY